MNPIERILEKIKSFFHRDDSRDKEIEELRKSIADLRRETTARFASIQMSLSRMGGVQFKAMTPEDIKADARKKILEDAYQADLEREPRIATDHGLIPPGADLNRGRAVRQHKDAFPRLRPEKE